MSGGFTYRPDWKACPMGLELGMEPLEECEDCRDLNMKEVFYVAHPVSGDIDANIANVIAWIHWLTLNDPSRIYIAPWVAEVLAFKNDPLVIQDNQARRDFYDRVLEDDIQVVRKLDGILLVGGKVSEGMTRERDRGAVGLTVQDWSYARTPADLLPEHIEALGMQ